MGRKGNHRHLTGLASSKFYNIHRKEQEYVVKAAAGRHSANKTIPLAIAVKKAAMAQSNRDVKRVLNDSVVLVNNKRVREVKYPVGLNDVVEFKNVGKSFAIGISTKGQSTVKEAKADYGALHFKVVGKYKAKRGAIMARLHDGSTVKADNKIKVNDSVVIDSNMSIKKILPIKEGASCMVVDGVHVGSEGTIKQIKKGTMKIPATVVVSQKAGGEFETIINNIMITG